MAGFSATDAALEGFRITREKPRALLAWAAFAVVVSAVGVAITLNMPQEGRAALESLSSEEPADPSALMSALAVLSPLLLFGLAVQRIMDAAIFRVLLRPQDNRFAYLRLGTDELRLMALRVIFLVLIVLTILVVQIAVGLLAFAASAAGQGVAMFVGSVAELFSFGVFIFLAVRMSLASVITFDRGRLSILESWALTRGHFWRLLGAYVLAVSCIFVVAVLAMLLFFSVAGIILVATGGSLADLGAIVQPQDVTLATYLSPFMIAYMLMGSFFTAIYYAVVAAPGAVAYRSLREAPAAA